jgi:DNA-binding HxlR family transcriptional regulator
MRRCCPLYHEAVELVGKRWSGAILAVLLESDTPLRFSEIATAVPDLSDRLLSERLKELECRGLVTKSDAGYAVTEMGRDLAPALGEIQAWARRWMSEPAAPR